MTEDIQIEFMKKSRFDGLKTRFKSVSPKAQTIIDAARPDDVLSLTLEFNSPTLTVVEAEVFDDKKFIELAF